MADMQTIPVDVVSGAVEAVSISMNIGTTIRGYRLQKGMSQGDIEKRTGLLRCYLSRVENGHTVPSLETLQKIARALDLQLSEFFAEETIGKEMSGLNLGEEEIRFLTQVQRYSAHLSDSDRRLLLAMVRMKGLPGRYVSGYLVPESAASPDSKLQEVIGGYASHAWAEVPPAVVEELMIASLLRRSRREPASRLQMSSPRFGSA